MSGYLRVEELSVYQKLCDLHIDVSALSLQWPPEERYELGSQIRRSSNSSPAQLAEKHDDRHLRNKLEGANRSRGEAAETVHHLFIALRKGYITAQVYAEYRERYTECIRMLNGMERSLENTLPENDRRWPQDARDGGALYDVIPGGESADSVLLPPPPES
jgi:four helix bundle protein